MVRERLGDKGRVVALDILPMQGIGGVDFILGDFRERACSRSSRRCSAGQVVDLVLSDMAPNLSGMGAVDQARSMDLAELAEEFAAEHLRQGRRVPDQAVPG